MAKSVLWLIKFFECEEYAEQFMGGRLFMRRLGEFKKSEAAAAEIDGRLDKNEAVAMWWQPDDLVIDFTVPGIGKTQITKKDLAAPVSIAYDFHDHLHIFCMYAIHTGRFELVGTQIDFSTDELAEIRKLFVVDDRCLEFGPIAVMVPAVPFLERVKAAFEKQGRDGKWRLVKYYDPATFHGEIPINEIAFTKQDHFSHQQEFRIAVNTQTRGSDPLMPEIGDISDICFKLESNRVSGMVKVRIDYPHPAKRSDVLRAKEKTMQYGYAHEKLYSAVLGMATSRGTLKERVTDAAIAMAILRGTHMPDPEINKLFEEITAKLNSRPARNPSEGTIQATVDQMSDDEVDQAAYAVANLFDSVSAKYHEELYRGYLRHDRECCEPQGSTTPARGPATPT